MDRSSTNIRQQELMKVAEQAAGWLMALEEGERDGLAALAQWLKESPLHVEMFLRMAAVDRMMDAVDEPARAQFLEAFGNTDADETVAHLTPSAPPAPRSRRKARGLGLAATLLAGITAAWWGLAKHDTDRVSTAVGEQRSVSLPDGSVLYMNADSRAEIHYSAQARDIRLVSGEALFKVQHDPLRPFRVRVDDTVVRALGTQFNIYRRPGQTTVSVIEGAVQIEPDESAATPPQRLGAGEGIVLGTGAKVARRQSVDAEEVTAWRQRRLIFRWATLGAIVDEFNRYNSSPQIRIDSPALRERRYTAVFEADAPRELLKFLERDGSVKVTAEDDELVISER